LEPLLCLSVYYVAFNYILHDGRSLEHLFIGIVAYRWFSSAVQRSADCLVNNGLMSLVYVHKAVFPLTVTIVDTVKFLFSTLLVIAAVLLTKHSVGVNWLALPLVAAVELLTIIGCSFICASITPFVPDFKLILSTLLQLMMFVSCVFFGIEQLSPRLRRLIMFNPIAMVIDQYRQIFLCGKWPQLNLLLLPFLMSIGLILIGWFLLHINNRKYPKIT